jgi:hypothetical protein
MTSGRLSAPESVLSAPDGLFPEKPLPSGERSSSEKRGPSEKWSLPEAFFFADMPGSLSVLTPLATPCESLEKAIFAAVRMTRLQLGDGERQTMTKGREGEMLLPPVSSL